MNMKDSLNRFQHTGVVPVVVLDDAKDAVPTAKALLAGGVDVMEITFRTAAAADSIKAVSDGCPDMLVGAGTVITLDQCKQALECGAKFIVSPGLPGGGQLVRGAEHSHYPRLRDSNGDHGGYETRPERGEVLPGRRLRRPESDEVALCSVRRN